MGLVEFRILGLWGVMLCGSEHFEGMDFLHLAGFSGHFTKRTSCP